MSKENMSKAIVLEQASEAVRELRAVELKDTGFGPQLSLDDGASKPFNFGVLKARKAVKAIEALKQFCAKHADYVPQVREKASKKVAQDTTKALEAAELILSKYSK